jgi:hypothetical protein
MTAAEQCDASIFLTKMRDDPSDVSTAPRGVFSGCRRTRAAVPKSHTYSRAALPQ